MFQWKTASLSKLLEKFCCYRLQKFPLSNQTIHHQFGKNWKKNDWTKKDGKPIKNPKLVKKSYNLFNECDNVYLRYIKGHAENYGNDQADMLARMGSEKNKQNSL